MLQEVLGRLESDLGQEVVALAMSLLVCSRDGKTSIILDLEATMEMIYAEFSSKNLAR
jgi:hypothetical protein